MAGIRGECEGRGSRGPVRGAKKRNRCRRSVSLVGQAGSASQWRCERTFCLLINLSNAVLRASSSARAANSGVSLIRGRTWAKK